jgi:uncharacterized protein YdeI (YjbR/CyaY-like superfamily)
VPTPTAYKRFEPKNRAAWRKWLEKHHDGSPGILLVYVKQPRRSVPYADAVEEALCFGWIDSTLYPIDDTRYMQLFTPRNPKSGWSKVNKTRVASLIESGLMAAPGHAKIEAAKRNGSWTALDHIETMTIPKELERALGKNRKARETFNTLLPFARKTYLYWINNAKRPETRAKRITQAIDRLSKGAKHPHAQPTVE